MASTTMPDTQARQPPTAPITFFFLPGEVRNLIFTYIAHTFPASLSISKHRKRNEPWLTTTINNLCSPSLRPLLTCFPGIAYANKQLYTELAPLLVQQTQFSLHIGGDIDYLAMCLRSIATPGMPTGIQRLVFPQFSECVQSSIPRGVEFRFIHSCHALRELSIMLTSTSLKPFTSPGRYIGHHMAMNLSVTATPGPRTFTKPSVRVESAARAWGLSSLYRLEQLEKFRMSCQVSRPGHGYHVAAFDELAELAGRNLELQAIGASGRVRRGGKVVERKKVEFPGAHEEGRILVFAFLVHRK